MTNKSILQKLDKLFSLYTPEQIVKHLESVQSKVAAANSMEDEFCFETNQNQMQQLIEVTNVFRN